MSALMSTFQMEAKGDAFIDADARAELDSANDAQYNTAPKIDLMQAAVKQVAEPDMQAANQPQDKKKVEAQQQFDSMMSKQINLGGAKDLSAGADAGNNRMKSAADAGQKFAAKAAELQKTATGADQKPSSGPSFARAAAGQAISTGMAAGVSMISPTAGAAMAAADIVAASTFSGRSSGPSAFKTTDSKGRENTGYGSATPEQSAAPVSTAFMNKMSRITGDVDAGRIGLTSAGLNGIETAPKLDMKTFNAQLENSVAFKGLRDGAFRNGLEVARADGEKPEAKDQQLDLAVPKAPNLGVFTPPTAPKPLALA